MIRDNNNNNDDDNKQKTYFKMRCRVEMAVNDVDNLETLFSNRHGKKNLQFDPNGRRPRTKRGKTSRNVRPNVICFRTKVGPTKIRAPNSSSAVPSSRIEIFPGKMRRSGRTRAHRPPFCYVPIYNIVIRFFLSQIQLITPP
jgi:hypothetical protein